MKILIVHPSKGFYGGAEEVVDQLYKYLNTHGHEARVVNYGSLSMLRQRTRELLSWADVGNVHNFPATLMPFPTKKPIVWTCNEPPELFTNIFRKPIEAFNRWWVKSSGMKVVVADEYQVLRFFSIYGVVPRVIPYGIDYKFWSGGDPLLGISQLKPIILQVGTVTPYKNQLESIKALESLKESNTSAHLLLIGKRADKSYYGVLKDYISRHQLIARVSFIDHMSHEGLRKWYKSASVLIHPVNDQGGWLVPFEAMCAGLPVVVTTGFTAHSIIENNHLGVVSDDLVCGIKRALKEDFSKPGEWVRDNLTWEKYGESMVKVFEEVLK